jgi:hypothetical protein
MSQFVGPTDDAVSIDHHIEHHRASTGPITLSIGFALYPNHGPSSFDVV